ncbi:MAG: DUF4294 domain-containing protein [Chitinophagales bacterium]|nr:DUF4294 domain-containing protein [Chitinophagales bacterium]
MNRLAIIAILLQTTFSLLLAQTTERLRPGAAKADTSSVVYHTSTISVDSTPTIQLRDVTIVSFKTNDEWMMYYKYKSRIQKVLPYVKIAKQLYEELKEEKAHSKKRQYRHYRKDLEEEMRAKFEKELKNLNTGQGEMLFKLINRETRNNAYTIIQEIKGSPTAWFYQLVGKRWGYDLKEKYDPEKEKMIELIIKEMGTAYNI